MSEDEAAALVAENRELRAANAALHAQVQTASELIARLEARVAELEAAQPPPPSSLKPNKPARSADKPPRRKRAAQHNHGRSYQAPTQLRHHALDNCPECGTHIYGNSLARKRQLVDLPPPQPVEVIEFRLLKRYCPHCEKWREPKLKLEGLALGHSHFSLRIVALVGWLRTSLRLPLRQIQRYLQQMHALSLSLGAISHMLKRIAEAGEQAAEQIKGKLRSGAVLYMDETGWRQDGENGYVWVMTNAEGYTYFEYHKSRAGAVARGLSGAHYKGTLCTDFYAAYNEHTCRHQRCWAHLLRDLEKLEEEQAEQQPQIGEWARAVVALYKLGQELDGRAPPPSSAQREQLAARLRRSAHELGMRWAREKGHPAQALCQRLLRHEGELFEFVRQAGVEATNNRSERAIRGLAVVRKISGGSRSEEGSRTRMRLQTLFSTWVGRGLDPFAECLRILAAQSPLPSS